MLLQALHYPWYVSVWMSLSPLQKNEMEKNIKITEDGKIEIIKMHKKFSILEAKPNKKDSIPWDFTDSTNDRGVNGVRYLTRAAALRTCKENNKHLLSGPKEVNTFINYFPWKSYEEKMRNMVKIFDLKLSGAFDPLGEERDWVDEVGYITISSKKTQISRRHEKIRISKDIRDCLCPFLAYENC